MSNQAQRDPAKEHYWRQQLQQWRKSGLSVRAFCQRQGLSEPSFSSWRRVLQHRQTEARHFVPVQVVPDQLAVATVTPCGLELLLAGGRRLRIGPDFEPATLRRLLAVLEEAPPSW